MKNKIIYTALLFTLLLMAFSACKKYTEVQPVSQYSIPQAFSDISNATTALVGVYDELQGDNGYGIRISMYYPYDTDEGIVSGNLDNGRRGVGRYQLLLTNAEVSNPFRQLYRGLEKKPCAIIMVYQKIRSNPEYYCIPTPDAPEALWDRFRASLTGETDNKQEQLHFFCFALAKGMMHFSGKQP